MPDIETHKRVHNMLLGPLERPALQWLAARQPAWMTPDKLLIIGVFGSILTLISYVLTNTHPAFLWLASLGFVINWYGDSLDGTLARFRKIERPKYGFFVDHIVDSGSQVMIFLGLGLSPFVGFGIAAVACIGYLLVSILTYVNAFISGEFRISYARIGPTEMRLIAVIANSLVFFFGNPQIAVGAFTTSAFELTVGVIAVVLIGMFLISAFKDGARWSRLDPGQKKT
jgi:archaetidylinositol phosphate synthase